MSLNKIELHPQLLAGLYADTLVESYARAVPDKPSFRFLGSNQKHIVIIVNHSSTPFLPDPELSFLTSVLAACKLSLADIAIINVHAMNEGQTQEALLQLEAKQVLLFATEPLSIGLPINFPPFQLQQFDKRIYLHAPSLSETESDKGLKQKLWSSLKTLFGI